jgi:predicted dehydrogenase
MRKVGFGVIGCGVISTAYLKAAQRFANLELRAVADMRSDAAERQAAAFGVPALRVDQMRSAAAERQAAAFGVPALRVDQLLKRDDIEIVVNLTVPLAHTDVSLAVLNAGKHVHSEKPLGVSVAEARKVMDLAAAKGLRVGCAPDTFLGGGHQTARKAIDDGVIGRPVAGTAFFMCPGHELWHPAPGFYYLRGGGPMLDMGPYYITDLIQLLGPIASIMGSVAKPRLERLVKSKPLNGTLIPVEVATHVAGLLEFASGAVVSIVMSFDVPRHNHAPIEIYGTEGSLIVPDPNKFGGEVAVAKPGGDWQTIPHTHGNVDGEFRSIGVADLAAAIVSGRPHRASGALALHALEAMEAFQVSADEGRRVKLETTVERPAMITPGLPAGQMD